MIADEETPADRMDCEKDRTSLRPRDYISFGQESRRRGFVTRWPPESG